MNIIVGEKFYMPKFSPFPYQIERVTESHVTYRRVSDDKVYAEKTVSKSVFLQDMLEYDLVIPYEEMMDN